MNSIENKWRQSPLNTAAYKAWMERKGYVDERFIDSQEFRDARFAFRKTVNESWGKEAC